MIADKQLDSEQQQLIRSVGIVPESVNLITDNDRYIVLLHLKSGHEITIYRGRKCV